MVQIIINDLPAKAKYVYFHGKIEAMPIYLKSNFVAEGEIFEEAGVQHDKMILKINLAYQNQLLKCLKGENLLKTLH